MDSYINYGFTYKVNGTPGTFIHISHFINVQNEIKLNELTRQKFLNYDFFLLCPLSVVIKAANNIGL